MIDYESEDVVLTRMIEGSSADLSDIANLPPAREDFDLQSLEVENEEADVNTEEEAITPAPEFVTSKKNMIHLKLHMRN